MPWLTLWVQPIAFTTHRGVTIYHTYNGMDVSCGIHPYRYTTAKSDAYERFHFDVRELPVVAAARLDTLDEGACLAVEQAVIREIIHAAIDYGVLRTEEPLNGEAEAS